MPTVNAGDVLSRYIMDTSNAEQAIMGLNSTMRASADLQQQAFGKVQETLNKVGNTLLVGGGAGLAAVGYFTKAAMDSVEAESLFEVTYDSNAKAVRAWSDNLSKEYRRNAYAVRNYAGNFAAVFKSSMGLEKATEYSEKLTALAYDIESFRNIPIDDVITRLQSGMSGQLEPMQRLGVDLSEVALKSTAASMGIQDYGSESDEATKRMVRFNAIMRQTIDAQGDVVRTSDSPTNSIRRMREEWEMTRVELGQAFIPALKSVLTAIEPLVNGLRGLSKETQNTLAKWMIWGSIGMIAAGGILKLSAALLAAKANYAVVTSARNADTRALLNHIAALDANTRAAIANGSASAWMPGMRGPRPASGAMASIGGVIGVLSPLLLAGTLAATAYGMAITEGNKAHHRAADSANAEATALQNLRATQEKSIETVTTLGEKYDKLKASGSDTTAVKTQLDAMIQQINGSLKNQITLTADTSANWKALTKEQQAEMVSMAKINVEKARGEALKAKADMEDLYSSEWRHSRFGLNLPTAQIHPHTMAALEQNPKWIAAKSAKALADAAFADAQAIMNAGITGDETAATKPATAAAISLNVAQSRAAAEVEIYRLQREEARLLLDIKAEKDEGKAKEIAQQILITQQKQKDVKALQLLEEQSAVAINALPDKSDADKEARKLKEAALTAEFNMEKARRDEHVKGVEAQYARERQEIEKTKGSFKSYSDLILNTYILKNRAYTQVFNDMLGAGAMNPAMAGGTPAPSPIALTITMKHTSTVNKDGSLKTYTDAAIEQDRQQRTQRVRSGR